MSEGIWGDIENEEPRGNKHKFGVLRVYASKVSLGKTEKGFSYFIPDIRTETGAGRYFNGKKPDPQGTATHIVLVLEAARVSGDLYDAVKDCITGSDEWQKIIKPSLIDVFGAEFGKVLANHAHVPVQLEEVPTGRTFTGKRGASAGKEVEELAWKFLANYPTVEAMKKESDAYFAKFGGGEAAPAGNGIPQDVIEVARQVYAVLGNNKDVFGQVVTTDTRLSQFGADKLLAAIG